MAGVAALVGVGSAGAALAAAAAPQDHAAKALQTRGCGTDVAPRTTRIGRRPAVLGFALVLKFMILGAHVQALGVQLSKFKLFS